MLYSTTGSIDSAFAEMTQAHCEQYEPVFKQFPNHTLFEVTDPSDVHIIAEDFGETLIGVIDVTTGEPFSEARLMKLAKCLA